MAISHSFQSISLIGRSGTEEEEDVDGGWGWVGGQSSFTRYQSALRSSTLLDVYPPTLHSSLLLLSRVFSSSHVPLLVIKPSLFPCGPCLRVKEYSPSLQSQQTITHPPTPTTPLFNFTKSCVVSPLNIHPSKLHRINY